MSSERRRRDGTRAAREEGRRRGGPHPAGEPLRELSYGGVVFRGGSDGEPAEIVAIVPRGKDALALPKGGAEPGETAEQAARREVREEAGIVGELRTELGDVTYWYRRGGRRVRKTVRFFLFAYASGSTDGHDHEVTDARWIPLAEAPALLTYPGERRMAERAAAVLSDYGRDR